jgi:hypothetical protein
VRRQSERAAVLFESLALLAPPLVDVGQPPDGRQVLGGRRQNRRQLWRAARERLLDDADRPMIRGYAEAALWGRAWKVKMPAVDPAMQRLAYFTNLFGDARIRAHVSGLVDPETRGPFEYRDGLFLTTRPGLPIAPAAGGLPEPLPARL